MHSNSSFILSEFFKETNWNSENHYSSLTLTSKNLVDFSIPPGLHLSLSNRPTELFVSALSLSTLVPTHPITYPPTSAPILGPPLNSLLSGQLTYIFSSTALGLTSTKRSIKGKERVNLKTVGQSFNVGELPILPELRDGAQPIWQGGERVDKQDFMLYGRLYAPSPRLDALYVHRITPTLQALISLISVPSPLSVSPIIWQSNSSDNDSTPSQNNSNSSNNGNNSNKDTSSGSSSSTAARLSELEIKLQQDTGRWSTEYSYAVGDKMWGIRGLYNFGKSGSGKNLNEEILNGERRERVVDEEEEMSTGLKGRWSAGGEVYFSKQERSAGVSTGVRFCTLPEPKGSLLNTNNTTSSSTSSGLSQPPTTITATLNPIMGQLSMAYSVATSPDSALGSRFDFNLFSYDADLTFGGEWFQRSKISSIIPEELSANQNEPSGNKKFDAFSRGLKEDSGLIVPPSPISIEKEEGEVVGVLKFRASTNTDLALLWEGRLGDFLVSMGVVADLRLATKSGGRRSPIRSIGIGIQYWS